MNPSPEPASDAAAVHFQGVRKDFGELRAVSDLDLLIPRGSLYGILGPNGSGKTTAIRMLMGILKPDRGRVRLLGATPAEVRGRQVGYLPEERGLYRKMRVLEQLVFLAEIRGVDRRTAQRRAQGWLDRLGLADRAGRRVDELSKGMQQKVQFIGAILHEPELLVLDEPFSGLDPINQDLLEEIVRELHARGATLLFSTHLMDQAERLCDRICLISRSRKILEGEVRELRRREGRGIVAIDFEGPRGWLATPEVVHLEESAEGVRVRLREGTDADLLLRRALDDGARISRFQRVEPRLHEIFVRAVGEAEG